MTNQEWLMLAQETIKAVIDRETFDTIYERQRKLEMAIRYIKEAKLSLEDKI